MQNGTVDFEEAAVKLNNLEVKLEQTQMSENTQNVSFGQDIQESSQKQD